MPDPTLFSVYGQMTALPGRRDDVIDLIKESVRAGGDDSGLLTYSINLALDDPSTVWVTELWTDQEAHDRSTRSEPVTTVTQRFLQLLAQRPSSAYGHAVYVHRQTPES